MKTLKRVISFILVLAISVVNIDMNMPINAIAATKTTIHFVDNTPEKWIANDSSVIELVDNTNGHDHYLMSTKDNKTWSVEVPNSAYNITFNRYNKEKSVLWNSWSAGGRDGKVTYKAEGDSNGYWSNDVFNKTGYKTGDVVYLDLTDFDDWLKDEATLYVNFTKASKTENSGNDIIISGANVSLYNPIEVLKEVDTNIYSYVVTEENEGATTLRFWRGDKTTLWNCSVELTYADYSEGINCIKVTDWTSTGSIYLYENTKDYVELEDGIINADYYYNYVIMQLLFQGASVDNIRLSDDYDNDGLSLEEEIIYGTNPFSADSDEDGLSDYEEIMIYNTNPLIYDTDGDGMGDGTEVRCAFNPLEIDTNGNGIDDGNEVTIQNVINSSFTKLDINKTKVLPSLEFIGSGDYSQKVTVSDISNNQVYQNMDYLVGHAFDIEHDDSLLFEESTIKFKIDSETIEDYIIEQLRIASYDESTGTIEILDTTYNVSENTVSAQTTHYSPVFVIDYYKYMHNIDFMNQSDVIEKGKADIVFVVDTTGSMSDAISNVKNNINAFVNKLNENDVDVRLGLIEYKDIAYDGVASTKVYNWYYDVNMFKQSIASLGASGGGDIPESAVDALEKAQNMQYRAGVAKYIILITDASYKDGTSTNPNMTMDIKSNQLREEGFHVSVITNPTYYSVYTSLVIKTIGVMGNISNNFLTEISALISRISDDVNDGCWIRLSDGSLVKLDADPNLENEDIDTDGDGVPDICELKEKIITTKYFLGQQYIVEMWTFWSNPAIADTDGDGIDDCLDKNPQTYDVTVTVKDDSQVIFNDGTVWEIFGKDIYGFMNYVCLSSITPGLSIGDSYLNDNLAILCHNEALDLDKYQVAALATMDINGVRSYLTYQSKGLREDVYKILTNEEPAYYKHTWSGWEKIKPRAEKWYDFFTGDIKSAADATLTVYYDIDLQNILKGVVIVGVIAGVTYLGITELAVIVQVCEIYGVKLGMTMYLVSGSAFTKMMVDEWNSYSKSYDLLLCEYADNVFKIEEDYWQLGPSPRGKALDMARAGDAHFGEYFPVVDYAKGNTLISIKSIDTTAKSYQGKKLGNIIRQYLRGLSVDTQKDEIFFDGVTVLPKTYSTIALEVIIPDVILSGQQLQAIEAVKSYATSLGLELILTVTQVK